MHASARAPSHRRGRPAKAARRITLGLVALRAFPVLNAKNVEAVAAFYVLLRFEEHFRLAGRGRGQYGCGAARCRRLPHASAGCMAWGELVGFVADPEGNIVSLAAPAT